MRAAVRGRAPRGCWGVFPEASQSFGNETIAATQSPLRCAEFTPIATSPLASRALGNQRRRGPRPPPQAVRNHAPPATTPHARGNERPSPRTRPARAPSAGFTAADVDGVAGAEEISVRPCGPLTPRGTAYAPKCTSSDGISAPSARSPYGPGAVARAPPPTPRNDNDATATPEVSRLTRSQPSDRPCLSRYAGVRSLLSRLGIRHAFRRAPGSLGRCRPKWSAPMRTTKTSPIETAAAAVAPAPARSSSR